MSGVSYLGEEKIPRLLFKMCTQTTVGVLLYSIYSITDIYFVSIGVNEFAAGGVSIASPILTVLGAVSTTVGAGSSSIVSRALGKGDKELAARVTGNAMLIFWLFAMVNTIFGLLFIEPLLYLLGATESLMPYAKGYATIILLGAISSTGFSAIIRAEGNTKFSLYLWVVPVFMNLVLDPLFIFGFNLGVEGAALSTVFAQLISMIMSIYFFFFKKRNTYNIRKRHFKIQFGILKEIFIIGFPSLLLQMSVSITAVLVNNFLKFNGGDIAISTYGIVSKIQTFLVMPQTGIVQGMQPIVGYNFGVGNKARVKEAVKLSILSATVYGLSIAVLGYILKPWLIGIFIKDTAMSNLAYIVLNFMLLSLPIKGIPSIIAAYYQSIGLTKRALVIPVVNTFIIQIPVLYTMSSFMNLNGIWISFVLSDLISLFFAIFIYLKKAYSNRK